MAEWEDTHWRVGSRDINSFPTMASPRLQKHLPCEASINSSLCMAAAGGTCPTGKKKIHVLNRNHLEAIREANFKNSLIYIELPGYYL